MLGRVEARGEDGCEARLAAYDESEAGEEGCEEGYGDGGEGPGGHSVCAALKELWTRPTLSEMR